MNILFYNSGIRDGLNAVSDMSKILLSNDKIEVYFKLYILLYADDTFILAESAWNFSQP